ncbi:unnamed protein product [Rhizoctonia solani]|uniref:Uncharacterized protein n=1 Tax=Rhizoctonia solani TaxID=456999 RepID=A0A8H3DU19_9AGAM|nr:unnamed protein product [Rhizoctonia solani]CAE7076622.1 unnamed protein product [Rhizoctonia solani]
MPPEERDDPVQFHPAQNRVRNYHIEPEELYVTSAPELSVTTYERNAAGQGKMSTRQNEDKTRQDETKRE